MINIKWPALVFVGSSSIKTDVKTAIGLIEWRSERIVGLIGDSNIDFGLPYLSLEEALIEGASTLVLGCAPHDGKLNPDWLPVIKDAIRLGYDIVSCLHDPLIKYPELVECANKYNVNLIDFRYDKQEYEKGSGKPRLGYRILTIGTDCSCGKKFTALSLHKAHSLLPNRDMKFNLKFCATGQTGRLISDDRGINNDTIPADFLSGAAEFLSPSESRSVFYIEGQGTLLHPSYGAGAFSLLYGSQPDGIVACHTYKRTTHLGSTTKISGLSKEIQSSLDVARRTNPNVQLLGISINFSEVEPHDKAAVLNCISETFGVTAFDPSEVIPNCLLELIENSVKEKYRKVVDDVDS